MPSRRPRVIFAMGLCALVGAQPVSAQLVAHEAGATPTPPGEQGVRTATLLDTVNVTGRQLPLSMFPGAVDVIPGEDLREGQRRVNLSDAVARVPGFTVRDRGNFAQDLQLQSRGFGARSTFGIRGIRLVADGLPMSAADGQGQAAGFALDTLDRIEVLRGPLALQYGNAAGGAIVGHTDHEDAGAALDAWADDQSAQRIAARWDGRNAPGTWRWRAAGSHFQTQGVRPHSAAERNHAVFNAQWRPDASRRLRVAVNSLRQPWTQDPLGLTRAQWDADPNAAAPSAALFDTRKRIAHHQLGLRWENEAAPGRNWWLAAHGGVRDIEQFLAIPPGAQAAPGSGGGVVDVARRESGVEAGHRWDAENGSMALGLELTGLEEQRRGYENFAGDSLGVRGRLRRDEANRVTTRAAFVLGERALTRRWNLLGGMRHVETTFDSRDHYRAPGNGDDSGAVDYVENAMSVGIARRFEWGETFASAGRGFETPTVNELSYRTDGSGGLNLGLRPARTRSIETGLRWRRQAHRVGWTLYRIEGRDEIVAASSVGGRATFANAGATRREGMELGVEGTWSPRWWYVFGANWLRADYTRPFGYRVFSDGAVQTRQVATGNRLPGVARTEGFAEIGWRSAGGQLDVVAEARGSGRYFVDDRNTDTAPGHALVSLRVAWRPRSPGWNAFARIDNLFDRDHVGSVIVNEGNGRFFEPGAGRAITLGLGWRSP